jgi:cytochrome c-type biogenesis protein
VQSTTGLVGAPLLGIALGLSWAPCTGPTLGAIVALSFNAGDPWRAALLGVAYSLGLGIPFHLVALGFGWATSATAFMRRHIRTVNIIGGALLILLGVLMVTGVWTQIMSRLTAVMGSVILPL